MYKQVAQKLAWMRYQNLKSMLRNYLLVSLRNLRRHFTYSFVNIFGLTVGLACTLVIGIWVYQEYSYEQHFEDADKIHRVGVNFFNIGDMSIGPDILRSKLEAYTDVELVASLKPRGDAVFILNNKEIPVNQVFSADQHFFDLFSYEFVYGDASSAMDNPESIVLTTAAAMQIFGREDVVNSTLQLKDDPRTYTVTGVVSTHGKSHIPTNIWLSQKQATPSTNWASASSYIYVKVDHDKPAERLAEILDEQMEEVRSMFAADQTLEEYKASGMYKFLPMPIKDIHLKSTLRFEPSPTGKQQTVDVFAGVAILILVLASINFINISTARSTTRAKEVGIRKSLGTTRKELIIQFTMEAVIVCLIAISLAIGAGELFLNAFERLTGLELLPTLFERSTDFFFIYGGAILLGIIAGVYPAIYITRFKPVKVLKGEIGTNEKGITRNGLVLFQFAISISLLIVSIFIFNQLKYIENKDMGFDMENVMVIRDIDKIPGHASFLKEELVKKSYVSTASINDRMPASSMISVTSLSTEEKEIWIQQFAGDEDLMESMGFRLLEGRAFSADITTDTSALIINEAAVEELGLEDPLGQTFDNGRYKVIGVISDFNYESLKTKVGPAMLRLSHKDNYNLTVKFAGEHTEELISELNALWAGFGVEDAPSYYFLDENFARLVEQEKVLSKAVLVFTILAMFISCLGLYGLSIFTAERRTKEIGIRRVLGASISNITQLLSRNFAKPILLAFVIAAPSAYYITKSWLNDYAYRIEIDFLPFVYGGGIALILGLVTIAWQAIRAALKNPVVSLRTE